jgi:hypothetical protein
MLFLNKKEIGILQCGLSLHKQQIKNFDIEHKSNIYSKDLILIDKLFNKLENERLILISNERDKRK